MKILKEGKWNIPWTTKVSCQTCEAELLVEEKDVKPVDYGHGYWCACVVCGKSIPIEGDLIAQRVREAADKERKYQSSYDCRD